VVVQRQTILPDDIIGKDNFKLGNEQRVLTFRWELYNVFNHTQFNSIDTTATFNATTGQQTSATFVQALGALPARQNTIFDAFALLTVAVIPRKNEDNLTEAHGS
jgi:hypothetical protein